MEDNSLEFWFRLHSADTDEIGRIICLLTGDNTYHVETRFRNCFWSETPELGVRALTPSDFPPAHAGDPNYWEVVPVPQQVTDEIVAGIETRRGNPYDYYGALLSGLRVKDATIPYQRTPGKDWCSMVGKEVGTSAGIPNLDPMPCPSVLRQGIKASLGVVTAASPVAGLAFADPDFQYLQGLVDLGHIDQGFAERVIAACQV
jgi:hypothetical protein